MLCRKCGEEFTPLLETAHLIQQGKLEQTCPGCKGAIRPLMAPKSAKISLIRTVASCLYRVDWFDAKDISFRWMALPPRFPRPDRGRLRRIGRRDDQIYAFVISNRSGRNLNTPHLYLRHNYDTFRPRGQHLIIEKIPGFQCPITGVDVIEVPGERIAKIEDTGGLDITVHTKDDTRLVMKFRNT